jgi:heptosyltransferase-2
MSEPLVADGQRGPAPVGGDRQPRRMLVVAPNWLGDAVMALPAIADIHRTFPSVHLIVAARGPVAGLFKLSPAVDEVVTLQWHGQWWRRDRLAADAARLRALGAEVGILLPNSFATAWLLKRSAIPSRWGYDTDMRRPLLSRAVRRPKGLHQGAYYQHLTSTLGMERGPLEPDLVIPDGAVVAARALLQTLGWDGVSRLVVLAPGAAYGKAKRWIPAHVARLATDLVALPGVTCAIVGSRRDAATTRDVMSGIGPAAASRVIDLTGRTTLNALAAVLGLAQACVSNDSGAMHLAAAVGTPLVALFGPTSEHETAPLVRAGGRVDVLTHPVWCRPCGLRECPIDHRCMKGISPQRVFTSVEKMMTAPTAH